MATGKKIKLCVVTSSRADYGLLYHTIKKISASREFKLQLVVTGTHLLPEFGNTVDHIIKDGFPVTKKVNIIQPGSDITAVGKTAGTAVTKFTETFSEIKPDAVLLLGDRFEIMAVAFAACLNVIPVVHFHGGEISEGANDDMFRHAITKMSALHFTSTKEYRNRVIQMGEAPKRVLISGALGIENIKTLNLLSRAELQKKLGIRFNPNLFLVTFHPATMEKNSPVQQIKNLLSALDNFKNTTIVITKANADAEGRSINEMLEIHCRGKSNYYLSASLGQLNYLSVMSQCDIVIGNSSSGIIEAPSFNKPVVNIGSRQNGRIRAACNFDCKAETEAIKRTIVKALKWAASGKKVSNPYDKGSASDLILKKLKGTDFSSLLPKHFYDIN